VLVYAHFALIACTFVSILLLYVPAVDHPLPACKRMCSWLDTSLVFLLECCCLYCKPLVSNTALACLQGC
jgi:hypothetical protein